MSLNVLVIPEDFRKDQYVLKPVIKALFAHLEKPKANVQMCMDPLLGGIDQATNFDRLKEVVEMYPTFQVFILAVDRDGKPGRRIALDELEARFRKELAAQRSFTAENAHQEIEVWALAGSDLPKEWSWQTIREEEHPKETYFEPYAAKRGLEESLAEGRADLGKEAGANYSRVRERCPELKDLERKIQSILSPA